MFAGMRREEIQTAIRYQGDDNLLALMSQLDVRTSLPEIKAYLMRVIWGKQSLLPSDVIADIAGDGKEVSELFREQILALWNDLTCHRNAERPFCFQKFEGAACAEDLVTRVHWRVREVQMLMPLFRQQTTEEANGLKGNVIASLEKLAIVLDSLSTSPASHDLPRTETELQRIDSELEVAFNRLGQISMAGE